jgi:hypothetical protein
MGVAVREQMVVDEFSPVIRIVPMSAQFGLCRPSRYADLFAWLLLSGLVGPHLSA